MLSLKNTAGIAISFILGSAIGGTVALLYAPKPGKQFRNDISRKTNSIIEDSRKKASEMLDGAKEITESALINANEVLSSNVDKVINKTDKIKEAYNAGYNAFNNERIAGKNEKSPEQESTENKHKIRT